MPYKEVFVLHIGTQFSRAPNYSFVYLKGHHWLLLVGFIKCFCTTNVLGKLKRGFGCQKVNEGFVFINIFTCSGKSLCLWVYSVLIIVICSTGSLKQYGRHPVYSWKHFYWQLRFFLLKNAETYYKENLNLNYPSAQFLLILNFNIKYLYILFLKNTEKNEVKDKILISTLI